jgi:hypothetical protein
MGRIEVILFAKLVEYRTHFLTTELADSVPRMVKNSAEHFDRENKGVETRQAVQSQLKCPRELVRRRSNLGAEKHH